MPTSAKPQRSRPASSPVADVDEGARAVLLLELDERGVGRVRRERRPVLVDRALHADLAVVLLDEEDARLRAPPEEAGDERAHFGELRAIVGRLAAGADAARGASAAASDASAAARSEAAGLSADAADIPRAESDAFSRSFSAVSSAI